MNTTKTIYNKLFSEDKVELESHKVELTLINDVVGLQKMVKERISLISRATNEINQTIAVKDKLKSEAKTNLQVLETNSNEINLLLKQITQAETNLYKVARELNLNVREIPEMKALLDLKNEMVNKFKNELTGKGNILEAIIK